MSTKFSSLPFTSVVGYHGNPYTCGVAKFNHELAQRLGVPPVQMTQGAWGDYPLLSLKWSELRNDHPSKYAILDAVDRVPRFGVFWHDEGDVVVTQLAAVCYYADPSLGTPGLFCPSLITPTPRPLRLFSFGMFHKLQLSYYEQVKALLERRGQSFHLRVSVGIHEGQSLLTLEHNLTRVRELFGPERVTILGCLSDEAVSEEFDRADCVLAFFEKGLRANNTTVHAALEHGKVVVTNHDAHTPELLQAMTYTIDGDWCRTRRSTAYSWARLLDDMTEIHAKTHDRIGAAQ